MSIAKNDIECFALVHVGYKTDKFQLFTEKLTAQHALEISRIPTELHSVIIPKGSYYVRFGNELIAEHIVFKEDQ